MRGIDWEEIRKAISEHEEEINSLKEETSREEQKKAMKSLLDKIEIDSCDSNGQVIHVDIRNEKQNKYMQRRRMLAYIKVIQAMGFSTDLVRELYKPSIEFLFTDTRHLMRSFIEDIKELDACVNAGAYKATLILAGSILEAFLLDWLSEIDGKNYFEEPYMVLENQQWVKRENLYTYINRIKEIKQPDWMECSEKAHFIRDRRNSVHAKVCLREEIEINQQTCEKVITYLTEIIDTRIKKRESELKEMGWKDSFRTDWFVEFRHE